jgi:hypothetical protein
MRFNSLKAAIIAGLLAATSLSASANTYVYSVVVTGSASPGDTTQVSYAIPANWQFVVVAVLPVVASVAANPASMNAAVDIGTPYGGGGVSYGQMYAAQWTVISANTGVQVSPAYQALSPFYLFATTDGSVRLRCSVGNMSGSCIFVTRIIPSGDPVF